MEICSEYLVNSWNNLGRINRICLVLLRVEFRKVVGEEFGCESLLSNILLKSLLIEKLVEIFKFVIKFDDISSIS